MFRPYSQDGQLHKCDEHCSIDRIMQFACSGSYVAVHLQWLLLAYPPTYLDAC